MRHQPIPIGAHAELHSDVEGVTDYEHLLNGVGLDAVVVATPVKHHFALAKASLLSGKHTLIEKPMASCSAECEELIEIAERKGLVLMVGHTFLYSAPVRKISRDCSGRRHWRDPLYQFAAPQPGFISKGHQRGLGPGPA